VRGPQLQFRDLLGRSHDGTSRFPEASAVQLIGDHKQPLLLVF